MTFEAHRSFYAGILDDIRSSGMWKEERIIATRQSATIGVIDAPGSKREVLNFCANNYLGLADHPDIVAAAKRTMDEYGFGLSSVRFICGTQDIHRALERRIARFVGLDDAILYSSCFDANAALFETLLGPEDAIITDALNHASIIDGIRLSKARRRIVQHADLDDYRRALEETADARIRLVMTDGVFSMHGVIAPLPGICDLAEEHGAIVAIDDCHAHGVLGATGAGTPEHYGLGRRVDIVTGTLGKALGGASGGFIAGPAEVVALLRQRSRPYLFSNTVAPALVGGAMAAFDILEREPERLAKLRANTRLFREEMTRRGFPVTPGEHPIVPVLFGDERLTVDTASALYERGLYVVGFTYPVVPKGQARIRVQLSAAHSTADVERAIGLFEEVLRDR